MNIPVILPGGGYNIQFPMAINISSRDCLVGGIAFSQRLITAGGNPDHPVFQSSIPETNTLEFKDKSITRVLIFIPLVVYFLEMDLVLINETGYINCAFKVY